MVEESERVEINDLYCTICGQDLNNPIYQICQHPIIPVAVCIICIDVIDSRSNEIAETEQKISKENGVEDFCSWCMAGEETLYLCGLDDTSNSCHHAFCRDCLDKNLGESYAKTVDVISSWTCLVCDNAPLTKLTSAMTSGQELSIYHESFSNDSVEEFNDSEEFEVATDIARLKMILEEGEKAQEMLECDHIYDKEMEIREELFKDLEDKKGTTSHLAERELTLYTNFWKKHLDIMQRQEADLFEKISYQGYDLTSSSIYDVEGKKLVEKIGTAQLSEYLSAEQAISERLAQQAAHRSKEKEIEDTDKQGDDEDEEEEEDMNETSSSRGNSTDITKMDEEARQDALVQSYDNSPDIGRRKYPSEFRRKVPERVLKALFYCSGNSAEAGALAATYSIPAHIRVVMKYASEKFLPRSVKMWTIADAVHPAVLKAIFHATPMERSTLCDAYPDLDPDVLCGVTDCGAVSDVYGMYCRRKAESKSKSTNFLGELSLRAMYDYVIYLVANCGLTVSVFSYTSYRQESEAEENRARQEEMIHSGAGRLLTSYKDDEEDEDDMEELRKKILKTSGIVLREKRELVDRKIRRQQSEIDRRVVNASSKELSGEKQLLLPPTESPRQHQYQSILQQVQSHSSSLPTQSIAKVLPIAASVLLSSKQKLSFIAWLEAYRRRFAESQSSLEFGAETINKIVKGVPLSVRDLVAVSGMKEADGSSYGEHTVATIYAFLESKDLLHLFPHAQPPQIAESMDWKNPIEYWKLRDSKEQPNLEVSSVSAERMEVDTEAKTSNMDDDSCVDSQWNSSRKSRTLADESQRDNPKGDTSSKHNSSNKRKYKKLSKDSSGGGDGGGGSEDELDSESGAGTDTALIEDNSDNPVPNPEGDDVDVDVDGGAASPDGQSSSPRTKACFESREARSQHKKNIESLFSQIIDLNLLQEKDSFGVVWPILQMYGSWRIDTTSKGRNMYTHLPDSIPADIIFRHGNSNRDYFFTEEGVLDFVYRKLKILREKMLRDKAKQAAAKSARSIGKEKAKVEEVIDLCSSTDEDKKPKPQSLEKNKMNDNWLSSSDSDEEGAVVDIDAGPPEISPRKKELTASKQTTLNFSVEKKKRPSSEGHGTQSKSEKKVKLSSETLQVQREERARKAERRVFHHYHDDDNTCFTINPDRPVEDVAVKLMNTLSNDLKAHQKEGLQVIWDNVIVSLNNCRKMNSGSGCILAHSMGLGKSLTVISFVLTILSNPVFEDIMDPVQPVPVARPTTSVVNSPTPVDEVKQSKRLFHTVLVVAPKNTLQNWMNEFDKWTPFDLRHIVRVTNLDSSVTAVSDRVKKLHHWQEFGGVMIISYDMFRTMTNMEEPATASSKKAAASAPVGLKPGSSHKKGSIDDVNEIRRYLLDPGPDLVVADEAHIIKDIKSKVHLAMNSIRTKRRVALTGTPLQNNLLEYYCMVNWVRNRFLGSKKEFQKRFMVHIVKGQSKDATKGDLAHMKKRSHVLHKKLKTLVHRMDVSHLAKDLKPMRQFILVVRMTDFQRYLYRLFLHKLSQTTTLTGRKNLLFQAYQSLLRVWNHPCVTVMSYYDDQAVLTRKKNAESKVKAPAAVQQSKTGKLMAMAKDLAPVVKCFEENRLQINAELDASAQLEDKLLGSKEQLDSSPLGSKSTDSDSDNDDDVFFDDDREWDLGTGGQPQLNQTIVGAVGDEHFIRLSKLLEGLNVTVDDVLQRENFSDVYLRGRVLAVGQKIIEVSFSSLDVQSLVTAEYYKSHFVSLVPVTARVLEAGTLDNEVTAWLIDVLKQSSAKVVDVESVKAANPAPSILQPTSNSGPLVQNDWWMVRSPSSTSGATKEADNSHATRPSSYSGASSEAVVDLSLSSEPAVDTISPSDMLKLGNKIVVFLSLLALSVANGEKMILFSQSINTLNLIELLLSVDNWGDALLMDLPMEEIPAETYASLHATKFSNWSLGREYLRIDGSTNGRQAIIDEFNKQPHVKLLIISTKAGNMGINLQAASRVVLFDCSWNPAHDLQAIFRAYRYGQQKSVFVYRLVASGTMEEKIHMRQLDKQTLSARVVDAQMPDNHFTESQKNQLMDFREEKLSEENQESIQAVLSHGTQDHVLRRLVDKSSCFLFPMLLVSIEDEGSLLEDNEESHLNDQERAAAEEEYDREIAADRASRLPQPPVSALPQNASTTAANPMIPSTDPLLMSIYNQLEMAAAAAAAATQKAPQTSILNQPTAGALAPGTVIRTNLPSANQPTSGAAGIVRAIAPSAVATASQPTSVASGTVMRAGAIQPTPRGAAGSTTPSATTATGTAVVSTARSMPSSGP